VRVVDVEYGLVGQQAPLAAETALKIFQRVLQRGAYQKILLAQAQRLAFIMVVLRVEHLGDDAGQLLLQRGVAVVAA